MAELQSPHGPRQFLGTEGVLQGLGSLFLRRHPAQKLYSSHRKLRIELMPILSVCRPRRYSQAAFPGIFGRTSLEKSYPSSLSICSVIEIAEAQEFSLIKVSEPQN